MAPDRQGLNQAKLTDSMLRVVVADGSLVSRHHTLRALAAGSEFEVLSDTPLGARALGEIVTRHPELVVVGISLADMETLELVRRVMLRQPTPIFVVGGKQIKSSELGLLLLSAGVKDIHDQPENNDQAHLQVWAADLLRIARKIARPRPHRCPIPVGRRSDSVDPELIAIVASTGGPAAVAQILQALPVGYTLPIVIAQHISAGFSEELVRWFQSICSLPVRLARSKMVLEDGVVYVAQDDSNIEVTPARTIEIIHVEDQIGARPSANVLLESVARVYGRRAVAVVLSGMGSDGAQGARSLAVAGATIFAQDESTSVVYGMARAAVEAGAVQRVMTIEALASRIAALGHPRKRVGSDG